MGYRANVVTQQREYGSQTFSNWEMFTSDFVPALEEAGYDVTGNDAEDFFEMPVEDLKKFVGTLPDDEEESIYPEYTNKVLKEYLQYAISETKDDYVQWEWF